MYCYLDLPSPKLVKMSQSYFAAFKLSAFCIGHLFDALANQQKVDAYFAIMTIVITLDAYVSYNYLMEKHELAGSEIHEGNIISGNWKHGLFYN
jgi:hypothetical protein